MQGALRAWSRFVIVRCPALCLTVAWVACQAGCFRPSMEPPASATPVSTSAAAKPAVVDTRGVAFADVAQERGIDYSWPIRPGPLRISETFGSGCAAFDADDDGHQDVLLVADPSPRFYRNQGNGHFSDKTQTSGLGRQQGPWHGCAVGDYDGDGRLDVLLTGRQRLALYRNVGECRFELATEQAGLDPANHQKWGASAGFMDLDGDAWLDLIILNYVEFGPDSKQFCEIEPGYVTACHPREYPPERGELWRNTGRGTFELVPGSHAMDSTSGTALVLAFIDVDDDRRMDVYIGNDYRPAELLRNLGEMKFDNGAALMGLAVDERGWSIAAMGADWADFDRDGDLDLAVSNFQRRGAVLFRNVGNTCFTNAQTQTGLHPITNVRLGFGTKWLDFENDGWADLSIVNGHVYHNADHFEAPGMGFKQVMHLLRNEEGKFVDLAPSLDRAVQRPMLGRGSATADFNNDGLVDLLVVDYEGPAVLLENRTQTQGHWLKLDLRSAAPNVFAYGASLTARAGDDVWLGLLSPATSYLSSSDPRIHWGLGHCDKLDEIVIRWPSGKEQRLTDVAADQILRVEEPR